MNAFKQSGTGSTPSPSATSVELELRAIDRQQRRFSRLSLLAIIVSFVHMAAALAQFSGTAWYEIAAALAMTALVDVATWMLASYFDYAARRQLARSRWIKATFALALAISMFLNGAYLYANRPTSLPVWMSSATAVVFAVFVPLLIGVASLIRGELEDDRLGIEQQAVNEQTTRSTTTSLRDATTRPTLRPATQPAALFANNGTTMRITHANGPAFAHNEDAPQTASANTKGLFAHNETETRTVNENKPPFAHIEELAEHTSPGFANETPQTTATTGMSMLPGNATPIGTSDVVAIVTALQAANVAQFANARVLGRVCGWTSSSSGHKALKHLLDAGAVRATDDGYTLVQIPQEKRLST